MIPSVPPHYYNRPVNPVPFRSQSLMPAKITASASGKPSEDCSIWRDTALRYAGYADEVGEFMTPYLGSAGKIIGYGISGMYCLADMGTTLPEKYANASPELTRREKARKTMAEGADLSLFHAGATMLIPPQIIGKTVETADYLLDPRSITPESRIVQKFEPLKRKMTEWGVHKQIQTQLTHAEQSKLIQDLTPRANQAQSFFQGLKKPLDAATDKLSNNAVVNRFPWLKKLLPSPEMGDELRETVNNLDNNLDDHVDNAIHAARLKTDDVARLCILKPWSVLLGIAMVPLIAHPFDKLMLKFQDWTIRPLLGKNTIIREGGKLKSVRNPKFWGETPKNGKALMPGKHLISTPHAPGYHVTRFGYQPVPLQYRYQPFNGFSYPTSPQPNHHDLQM